MRDAGIGQSTRTETNQEQVECLLAEAREILEMTSTPGWRSFYDPLRQTAMDAARRMLIEEDPVEFFRSQATLAFAQRLVDTLRRPFEDVKRLDPGHPLAGQGLPCAAAFEEALARCFNVHMNADVMIENDRRSRAAQLLQKALAMVNRRECVHVVDQELDSGDGDDEDASSGSRPGSRKLKHPWRASCLDKK